jgi:K+-sensing histidine kinase KdpD
LAVAWPIDAPSSCFLLAVMVSGLFGGLGPGLLSVGLSALAFDYFFLRRTLPPAVEPAIYLRSAVFLVATLLITGLMEIKRRVEESRNHAEGALRQAQADLARVSRVTTIGEFTASLAHEVNQPIAAAVTEPARGFLRSRRTRYLMRSLPRSLTGPAWAFGSAAPSWNRTAAACGPSTGPRAAQALVSLYPPKPRPMNDACRRSNSIRHWFRAICLVMAVLGPLYQSIIVPLLMCY